MHFLSCSCSRVDHVCVFLFEQIDDDDDDDDDDKKLILQARASRNVKIFVKHELICFKLLLLSQNVTHTHEIPE